MPFTFSHPALIFPIYKLREKWFSISGLIIGSIAPDFEYYFRMKKGISHYSHSTPSILYFNLPVALLLTFIFHAIVRKQLINHLPPFFYKRFCRYYSIDWKIIFTKKLPILIICIIIGSFSHIAWDWVTHLISNLLYTLALKDENVVYAPWEQYNFLYFFIHITFSLIGLAFLAKLVIKLPFDNIINLNKAHGIFWVFVTAITLLIFIITVLFSMHLQIIDMLVCFISAFLLSMILNCAYTLIKEG